MQPYLDKALLIELTIDELSSLSGGGIADVNPNLVAGVATNVAAAVSGPLLGGAISAGVNSLNPNTLGQAQFQLAFQNPANAVQVIAGQLGK